MKRLAIAAPALTVALSFVAYAQEGGPARSSAGEGAPTSVEEAQGAAKTGAGVSRSAGFGRPPIVISATTESEKVRLQLPLPAVPEAGNLEVGLLTNDANPNLRITPKITLLLPYPVPPKPGEIIINAEVSGLVPFGDSTAPILHRGQQVETLRIHKAGLAVVPALDGALVARQGDGSMLIVLENLSEFDYQSVRARLRFQDVDSCAATSDQSADKRAPTGSCDSSDAWHRFNAPKFSRVSLRATMPSAWFYDADSGIARSAIRKGTLTLRYQGASDGVQPPKVFEQNIPLEARFDPSTFSLTRSFVWVGSLLFAGAMLSLILRVSIPNYRRKKALKDQLDEARRATADISDQVNSQLRVLLRVERLALDQRRRDGWVILPAFSETAALVESGLATLKRKIALVQRLDAAACRQEVLLEGTVSPTRLAIIERNLIAACEGLKADQLSDSDWIFVQQRLEGADKALNEPTQEEKQAFEALLSQRWKSIRDHFGIDKTTGELIVPKTLAAMADCLPDASLLPKPDDADGMGWINAIGLVRADLQITALELVREVQFLAPTLDSNQKWIDAIHRLTQWLATPALGNLTTARAQLLQLAEGICPEDLVKALQDGEMEIESDPQFVNPNQTVRVSVRFRNSRFNTAAARGAIQCEWQFYNPVVETYWRSHAASVTDGAPAPVAESALEQKEPGWKVHRYFEPGVAEQKVEAIFFFKGQPVAKKSGGAPVTCSSVIRPRERGHHKMDRQESYWRILPQALQLAAALLVPLAALTLSTANGAAAGQWWELVGLGFGSETIRNILTGSQSSPTA